MKLQQTKGYVASYFYADKDNIQKWSNGFNIYTKKELVEKNIERDFEYDTHASSNGYKLKTWITNEVRIWKESEN
jgi:hypothetical protein